MKKAGVGPPHTGFFVSEDSPQANMPRRIAATIETTR
jgi:hypothetical protein